MLLNVVMTVLSSYGPPSHTPEAEKVYSSLLSLQNTKAVTNTVIPTHVRRLSVGDVPCPVASRLGWILPSVLYCDVALFCTSSVRKPSVFFFFFALAKGGVRKTATV